MSATPELVESDTEDEEEEEELEDEVDEDEDAGEESEVITFTWLDRLEPPHPSLHPHCILTLIFF